MTIQVKIKVIEDPKLSKSYDPRYIIIEEETGKVIDDAQGYGYKSQKNAYKAYTYKNRDKSKDKQKKKQFNHIKHWMNENRDFIELMCQINFEIDKGSWGEKAKFNTRLVQKMLKDNNLEPDFKASELLKVFNKIGYNYI